MYSKEKWPSKPQMEYQFQLNPYESFMKRHLEHYGYYTGRNEGYRDSVIFRDWEKTHSYKVSSNDSDSDDDCLDRSYDANRAAQEELLRTKQVEYSFQHGRMVPKLREPRQLYALMGKELGPQQAARWPSEIEVLEENLKHIPYVPPVNEPFYKPTGFEKKPGIRSEEGRVVYDYEPQCGPFFLRSRVGGYRNGCHHATVKLTSDEDETLLFESRFESGNLQKAVQVGECDYELWLRPDLYTNKHTQWFYFRVSNTRANKSYRFTLVNFMKPDSLYNNGMRPIMYSEKRAFDKKQGWLRFGSDIKYYKSNHKYPTGKGEKSYYALTFVVEFPNNKDTCYIAHCYPYTYTDLQDYIANLTNDPVVSKICKQRVLCRTLGGNLVYVLTITAPNEDNEKGKNKKAVVVTARVHPGETNSSWMMKGLIDYLNGNSADAKLLRDTFVFKIIPMLNPDGVIVGNYRCSLAGRDLNRNYKSVLKDAFPTVWHTKNMIRKLNEEREIIVYCDLHGHSRKQNVFIYGCENKHNPARRLRERIFPVMLSRNASDKFSYEECKFKVQKSKEGTGRIVFWNMGIMNSYTMEATFCGSTLGKKKNCHFTTSDYEKMGYHFCDTLLDYCDPDTTKYNKILSELEDRLKQEILARLARRQLQNIPGNLDDIDLSDDLSGLESSTGGSDSSLSDGLPVHLQYLADAKLLESEKKKKRLRSKKERDKQRNARQISKSQEITPTQTLTIDCDMSEKPRSASIEVGNVRCPSARNKSRQDNKTPSIVPINTLERSESRAEKRREKAKAAQEDESNDSSSNAQECLNNFVQDTVKTEYLEALTNAYLKSGVLVKNEAPKAHFRFTRKPVMNMTGGTTYREPTFTAQFVARHINKKLPTPAEAEEFAHFRMTKREGPLNFRSSISPGTLQHHIGDNSAAQQHQQDILNNQRNASHTTGPSTSSTPANKTTPSQATLYTAGDSMSASQTANHVINSTLPGDKTFSNHSVLAGISPKKAISVGNLSFAFEDDPGKAIRQHPPPFDEILEEKNGEYLKRGYSAKPSSSHSSTSRTFRTPSATSIHQRGRSQSVVEPEEFEAKSLLVGGNGRETIDGSMDGECSLDEGDNRVISPLYYPKEFQPVKSSQKTAPQMKQNFAQKLHKSESQNSQSKVLMASAGGYYYNSVASTSLEQQPLRGYIFDTVAPPAPQEYHNEGGESRKGISNRRGKPPLSKHTFASSKAAGRRPVPRADSVSFHSKLDEQIMNRHGRQFNNQTQLSDTYNPSAQSRRHVDNRRIKSVSSDISNELRNVKQLRQSLSLEKIKATCSPTTGKYIDQIVQQTDEEIAELEHDIRETQLESEFKQERKEFSVSGSNSVKSTNSAGRASKKQNHRPNVPRRTPGPPELKDYKKPGDRGLSETDISIRNSEIQRTLLQNKSDTSVIQVNGDGTHPNVDQSRTLQGDNKLSNGHLLITPMFQKNVGPERNLSANSSSSQEKMSEPIRRETISRGKMQAARNVDSFVGPTKVSLMISSRHGDRDRTSTQRYKFAPLVRTNRPPLLRHPPNKRR